MPALKQSWCHKKLEHDAAATGELLDRTDPAQIMLRTTDTVTVTNPDTPQQTGSQLT